MNLFWAVVLGVVTFLVAHLVLNEVWSMLLAFVVAVAVAFGWDHFPRR